MAGDKLIEVAYAGAFGDLVDGKDFYMPCDDFVNELVQKRLLQAAGREGFWTLTDKAASVLIQTSIIHRPRPLHKFQRDLPVDDLTILELVTKLGADGWTDKVSARTSRLMPYSPTKDKVCYHYDTISRAYLKCILQVSDVFAAGLITELHHYQLEARFVRY